MTAKQINLTLGTAGHIDHGKTALVKALTGCDTDRLKEEKERGMSIELGFAPCTIAGTEVGIVDVPGHENFIKTMVAGAVGMDAVILVVAADDGIMPQTREHLEILTLLGIGRGLVALTKIDRVTHEQRQSVTDELRNYLRGTFLEDAPILPLSNITGEGFDAFLTALWALIEALRPKAADGVFRLPLDKAFTVQGYGTVVAGIPLAGQARLGDEIELLPHGLAGRIKRIEVYGRDSDVVLAGQCAAVNVGHWDRREIGRGDVIATPGYFSAEEWYVGRLRVLPRERIALKSGGSVKFHTGTSETLATIYPLDQATISAPGEYFAQFRMERPIVAGPGDHFIIRSLSPLWTIGGGVILEATPQRLKRNRPNLIESLGERLAALSDDRALVEHSVRRAPAHAVSEAELARQCKVLPSRLGQILESLVTERRLQPLPGRLLIHQQTIEDLALQLAHELARFHAEAPQSPGATADELRPRCALEPAVFKAVVKHALGRGDVVERHGRLALATHRPAIDDEYSRAAAAIEAVLRERLFSPPDAGELAALTGLAAATVARALAILREHDQLVAVEGLLFHREAVDKAREILTAFLQREGRLESVRFKYLLNTTRKYAIPLLDHFDRIGVTQRVGNTRTLRGRPAAAPRDPPRGSG